jgi:hypothetical protein
MPAKNATFRAFFGAFCAGTAFVVEYRAATATSTSVPTSSHTVKIIQTGRTLYFSEHRWRRARLLGVCAVGLGILGLVVMAVSLRLPALVCSVTQAFRDKTPIWGDRASEPPPLPPSKGYRWFGVVMFGLAVLLMLLIVFCHFMRWVTG